MSRVWQQWAATLIGLLFLAVWVSDAHSQTDRAPELSKQSIARIISHGPWPEPIPADPGNRYSGDPQSEAIGAQLFRDPTLSANGQISCASCHIEKHGFAEPLARAKGLATHDRNTQGLLNVGMQRWFGWDGGTDSLWAASLRPMLSPIEMGATIDQLAKTLRAKPAFIQWLQKQQPADPNDEQIAVAAAMAIGAWMRTLRSPKTAFDEFRDALASGDAARIAKARQTYPASAQRGLAFFVGPGRCQFCHFGADFSNGEFHDIGRPFIVEKGRVDPGRYRGIQRLRKDPFNLLGQFSESPTSGEQAKTRTVVLNRNTWGQWRTPSLRNLAQTAPYMHDGSLATLDDVIQYYSTIDLDRLHTDGESLLRPLQMSDAEVADLKAFLLSLSVAQP